MSEMNTHERCFKMKVSPTLHSPLKQSVGVLLQNYEISEIKNENK